MFQTKIPLYGICILISFIFGLGVIFIHSKELKISLEYRFYLIFLAFFGGICGAKYYTYFTNLDQYQNHFNFFQIGFSSLGAVIGILIMMYFYSRMLKIKYEKMLEVVLPSIPLMYAIGKIGCFLAGCCYGIEYHGLFSIVYHYSIEAPNGISLFPVQIFETIVFLILYIIIEWMHIRNVGVIMTSCGVCKFVLDFLRHGRTSFLTINQVVCFIFILIGIVIIYQKRKNI